MAEKNVQKTKRASELKHGDIIEKDGTQYLVRVRGINRVNGVGLDREISKQTRGNIDDPWEVIDPNLEVLWVGQIDTALPYQLSSVTKTEVTKPQRLWWQFWKSS